MFLNLDFSLAFFSVTRIQSRRPPKPSHKFLLSSAKALGTLKWCWTSNSTGLEKHRGKEHRGFISKAPGCADLGKQVKTSYIVPLIQTYHFCKSKVLSLFWENSPYTFCLAGKSLYVAVVDHTSLSCSPVRYCSWSHYAPAVVSCTENVLVNSEGPGAEMCRAGVLSTYLWGFHCDGPSVGQLTNLTQLTTSLNLQYHRLWTLSSLLSYFSLAFWTLWIRKLQWTYYNNLLGTQRW